MIRPRMSRACVPWKSTRPPAGTTSRCYSKDPTTQTHHPARAARPPLSRSPGHSVIVVVVFILLSYHVCVCACVHPASPSPCSCHPPLPHSSPHHPTPIHFHTYLLPPLASAVPLLTPQRPPHHTTPYALPPHTTHPQPNPQKQPHNIPF